MNDAFDLAGADSHGMPTHAGAQDDVGTADGFSDVAAMSAEGAAPAATPELSNGFVTMGLAPELLQAVQDLGFTQPTVVQEKTIPLAMHGNQDASAKFIDLMVSSQTGSGKTAAFLLPVLHTLLQQRADAVTQEREAFERACAEASAKGEAPPKRAKRKDPTSSRNFKAV